ncbi:MAG: transcription termination factor Rho [Acidimicrobiales bacterium]
MSGEQLERSILERKERDELRAIATAMSLEPVARTKKADLVDQILRAAGVEVSGQGPSSNGGSATASSNGDGSGGNDGEGAKPRTRRTRAKPKSEDAAEAGGQLSLDGAAEQGHRPNGGEAAKAGSAADGPGPAPRKTAGRTTRAKQSAVSTAEVAPASDSQDSQDGSDATGTQGSRDATGEAPDQGGAPAASGTSAPIRVVRQAGTDIDGSADVASPGGTSIGSNGTGRGQNQAGGRREASESGQGIQTRQQRQGGGNPGNSASGGQGQGGASQGGQFQGQSGTQGELGNRRSRRRRGRDRGDREVQGAGRDDATWSGELVPVKGLMDLRDEGYGFLRTTGYLPSSKDVYVSVSQARRFALRRGDAIEGACRPAGASEKYPALLRIDSINGMTPDEARERPKFEDLTPLFPDERLRLESRDDPLNTTARIIDLISPIGKGQRGMIVSPSKAGKTTIMKQIAHSVELNNPGVHLMVLLVDERPEEVTDMRRSVKGEVIASTFDRPADEHTLLSEITLERAKRLVEMGRDVVIILDGITRLARAYNLAQPATGRIMSGGVDSGALYPPKKFFGAARNVEEGGSLTILATALIETGSKMDEVIFEEFKGTGNMELRLDRKLAERRIYPAIDVNASSTRHEELLFDRSQLQQVWKLRRVLNALGAEGSAAAGLELLQDKIKTTRSNDEFLAEIAKAPTPSN